MLKLDWSRRISSQCSNLVEVNSFNTASVLVTGAGRGIGKRLAIGLLPRRGAKVGLLARSKAEIDLCHLEIGHAGGSATKILADVRDYERMSAVMHQMRIDLGGVDVLVCAAAVQGPIGPFIDPAIAQGLAGDHRHQPHRRDELLPRRPAADDRTPQRENHRGGQWRNKRRPPQLFALCRDENGFGAFRRKR